MSKIYTKRLDGTTSPAKEADTVPNLRREREEPLADERPRPVERHSANPVDDIDDPFMTLPREPVPVDVSYKQRKATQKPADTA